jgi:hypothetical protein
MGGDMETKREAPTVADAAMLAILREAVESAADRVIARKERDATPRVRTFTPGHLYLIIGSTAFILIVAIGALQGGH